MTQPATAILRRLTRRVALCGVGGAFLACPAFAQGARKSVTAETDIQTLKPGEFLWEPRLAPLGPMAIFVNLTSQRAYVYRNGVRIGASTISSGRPGFETPTGVFTILQKDRDHRSNRYNNAKMPFTERLTWDGVALHAGGLPGYPSSHGCIHLPLAFSKLLFDETHTGMVVIITKEPPLVRTVLAPTLLTPAAPPSQISDAAFVWRPDLSPKGPMTVLASGADQRALILRNGVIIGRAKVTIPPGKIVGTHALQFTRIDPQGKTQWVYVGLPGHEGGRGAPLPPDFAQGIVIPPPFYAAVRTSLEPSTTMLLTNETLVDTGTRLTVVSSV